MRSNGATGSQEPQAPKFKKILVLVVGRRHGQETSANLGTHQNSGPKVKMTDRGSEIDSVRAATHALLNYQPS